MNKYRTYKQLKAAAFFAAVIFCIIVMSGNNKTKLKTYIFGLMEKNIEYFFMSVDAYAFDYTIPKAATVQHVDNTSTELASEEIATPTESPTQTEPQTESVAPTENVTQDNILAGTVLEAAAGIIPREKLLDYNYVINNFYVVPTVTELTADKLQLQEIANLDMTIEKDSSKPQILIFHTHGQEAFADSGTTGKTIVDVGTYLTTVLTEQYGYNVMHITDSFDLVNGVFDRSEAYTYANARLEEVLEANPSIEVVIDLHRDGVADSMHLVTEINGKQTAKIMLFNGISHTREQGDIEYLYNPYLKENLALTYQMYLIGKMYYPDFVRCIYVSGYRYCLHHVPRSMLIEAGAQTNTYEEMINAMDVLAVMLDKQFSGM